MTLNIHDDIDASLAKAVVELRTKYNTMSLEVFSGQVTGVLLATAIKLAKQGGCPRHMLEEAAAKKIANEYGN